MGDVVSEEDMRRLIESIDAPDQLSRRDRAIIELAYGCGARLEEMTRLNVDAVDLSRGLVHLTGKGRSDRIIPLTRCAVSELRRYLQCVRPGLVGKGNPERALFIGLRGTGRLCSASLCRIVQTRAEAVNLIVHPHTIRRSIATHLVERGAPIAYVKAFLGHATYRHLGHYVRLREALDVDALREGSARK
ncbi:MAG TPA: tyrosine-type recombinase/integrase [Fimbriimonas sp.]|nr:tyrosine-type recombinase/integrase [Fimbriimonas sp.]